MLIILLWDFIEKKFGNSPNSAYNTGKNITKKPNLKSSKDVKSENLAKWSSISVKI